MAEIAHKFVESNGIKLHYAEAGNGPLVVMCHGFPESWYSWRHQIQALADAGFRVVAPDQRGYGQTEAPSPIGFEATTWRFAADSAESPSSSRLSAIQLSAAAIGSVGRPVAR